MDGWNKTKPTKKNEATPRTTNLHPICQTTSHMGFGETVNGGVMAKRSCGVVGCWWFTHCRRCRQRQRRRHRTFAPKKMRDGQHTEAMILYDEDTTTMTPTMTLTTTKKLKRSYVRTFMLVAAAAAAALAAGVAHLVDFVWCFRIMGVWGFCVCVYLCVCVGLGRFCCCCFCCCCVFHLHETCSRASTRVTSSMCF